LAAALAPGQNVSAVLKFSNPGRAQFTFRTRVRAAVQEEVTATSATTVLDAAGGTVQIPGIATLVVPTGAVDSAAIQMLVTSYPQVPQLLQLLPGFASLDGPQLKIKFSQAAVAPVYLSVHVADLAQQLTGGAGPMCWRSEPTVTTTAPHTKSSTQWVVKSVVQGTRCA